MASDFSLLFTFYDVTAWCYGCLNITMDLGRGVHAPKKAAIMPTCFSRPLDPVAIVVGCVVIRDGVGHLASSQVAPAMVLLCSMLLNFF